MNDSVFILIGLLIVVYILGDLLNDKIIEKARKHFNYDNPDGDQNTVPLSLRVLLHKYAIWVIFLIVIVLYKNKEVAADFKDMPSDYLWCLVFSTAVLFIGGALYLEILSKTNPDTFLAVRTSGHLLASFVIAVFILHTKTLTLNSFLGVALVAIGIPLIVYQERNVEPVKQNNSK